MMDASSGGCAGVLLRTMPRGAPWRGLREDWLVHDVPGTPDLPTVPVMAKQASWPKRSDRELVAACLERDAGAWRALVDRYRRLVYGVALSFRLQPADADEVFQQTFAELLRWLPRLREPERLEAWLVTAARRGALRLRRDERRRMRAAEASAGERDAWATHAGAELERLRARERVARALDALGEPCAPLLIGVFSEPAVPYRALAARLGLAIGSLGSLRARCLERLRRLLRSGRHAPGAAPTGRSLR